jgi:hypothetical protein
MYTFHVCIVFSGLCHIHGVRDDAKYICHVR